ncbi:T9SS type A sorting domain-containing protein [Spirosoma sp. BT704]|uniref:T9SS type A sorting domain-containing protein n=2 Tax=Spirosoma validum TaxID=2771355 RepID=A0A927AZ62_9BACT|nr:T9SS type A sorting domain-containing protein [Spirosoma validum]
MGQLPRLIADQRAREAAGERNTCRLAVEIDSDTYREFEKDTNRIRRYVLSQVSRVSKVFEREINTQLVVVNIHIWKDTEPDPYRGEFDAFKLFSLFWSTWEAGFKQITYDKRIYLFTKYTSGASGVGGGVQAISQLNTHIIAHELGHCFDSPHTHSCYWPGGPIDYFSTIEGDCYSGSLQNSLGTIMSYGYNHLLSFHPLCQALMTNHAVKTLPKLVAPSQVPVLPDQLTLSGNPYLYWNGQPMAERYDLDIASDAGSTQNKVSDTTQVNGYDMSRFNVGQTYYVRVRAVNRFGLSGWSASCQLRIGQPGAIPAPTLFSPVQDQWLTVTTSVNQRVSIVPVASATAYEVQFVRPIDDQFITPVNQGTYSETSFTIPAWLTGTVLWRVRAVVAGQKGPWSSTGRFVINKPYAVIVPFDITQPTPLKFPYQYTISNYTSGIYNLTIQTTVATDTLFTKPTFTKTVRHNGWAINGMIDKLLPNTQYYLKVEEINDQLSPEHPAGVVSRRIQPFRTGTNELSSQWTFINSGTDAKWPQGLVSRGSYMKVATTADAAYVTNADGLVRISQDSLTWQPLSRDATNGQLGNMDQLVDMDQAGNLWSSNRLSVNVYENGYPVPYFQVGKWVEKTRSLVERQTNKQVLYFLGYEANNRLFYSQTGLYQRSGDNITEVYNFPGKEFRKLVGRAGVIWVLFRDYTTSTNELLRYNTITRTADVFSMNNTPQLGKFLDNLTIDGSGNVWVSQINTASPALVLAKFDGQSWTSYSGPRDVNSFVFSLASDPAGILYVVSGTNGTPGLYKFNGKTWQKLTDMPFSSSIGSMAVDARGNVWFNGDFQLIRYASCMTKPAKPTVTATKQLIEAGQSVTLQATGCSNLLWSWRDKNGSVNDQLLPGANPLVVNPLVNTTYRSRCYEDGCAGEATTLDVTLLPKLALYNLTKNTSCQGDSLKAAFTLDGEVAATNQFSFVVKTGTQTTLLPASIRSSGLVAKLPVSLAAGQYVVYAQTTEPTVRSRDSLQLTVLAAPTAELSSDKVTLVPGDSARVSITLSGLAPWRFVRWDNQVIQTAVSPYAYVLKATQPINYNLFISTLSDANCSVGTVKNSLVVSAMLLASEPLVRDGIMVYPNPTSNQLLIELKPGTAPLSGLGLWDSQGRAVGQKRLSNRPRQDEWDMSGLPAGQYILRIETQDGGVANWKVIKQ